MKHAGFLLIAVAAVVGAGCGSRTAALDDLAGSDSGAVGSSIDSGGSSSGSSGGSSSGSGGGGSSGSSSGSVAVDSGACPGGESLCMGACVNEQTDPANCGGCGVACGGTCALGRCLVTLASTPPGVQGLAVDGTTVYWTVYSTPGGDAGASGALMGVPVGGGAARVLAANQASPRFVAVDGTSVYWLTTDGLLKLPPGGGAPVTLASGGDFLDLAVDATTVYWTDPAAGTVNSVPSAGGPVSTLASGRSPSGIAVDAANVYWVDQGSVMKVPLHGGTVVTVSSPGGSSVYSNVAALPLPVAPGQIAQSVYWGDYDLSMPSLLSAPAAGGPAVALTSLVPMIGKSLAVDDTTLYWIPFSSAVMGMPSGGGTPVTLASFPAGGNYPAIAVDATSLYWIHLDGAGQTGYVMKLTPR